jgi:5'-methylthioadenosine phosphorylase
MGIHIRSAIIAGTGLGSHIQQMNGQTVFLPTPHGLVKGIVVQHDGTKILCLRRHSAGHKVPPHRVNYLAVGAALKAQGVQACLASAAVGCLNPEWQVGEFVMCEDFIDLSARKITTFDQSVEHRDFSHPFSERLNQTLRSEAQKSGLTVQAGGIYANLNGPRYETPQEVRAAGILGANLVGMTAGSEAIVMKELNVPYACVCVVTNAAAGMQAASLEHLDVVSVMERKGKDLLDLLLKTAAGLASSCT